MDTDETSLVFFSFLVSCIVLNAAAIVATRVDRRSIPNSRENLFSVRNCTWRTLECDESYSMGWFKWFRWFKTSFPSKSFKFN
jgi:hypothetical protein